MHVYFYLNIDCQLLCSRVGWIVIPIKFVARRKRVLHPPTESRMSLPCNYVNKTAIVIVRINENFRRCWFHWQLQSRFTVGSVQPASKMAARFWPVPSSRIQYRLDISSPSHVSLTTSFHWFVSHIPTFISCKENMNLLIDWCSAAKCRKPPQLSSN